MKTPRFWYRPAGPASVLLSPLSLLYRAGGALRRMAATPYKAKIPVICIGNIVAGGAGKTPTALAVAGLLKQQGANPVFVTRGYSGREHGPLRVDPARHAAQDVGDEALLLACAAPTWVGRDRAAAIKAAEDHGTHIILDDGLQNPHIRPDMALLVIDGESGLGNGRIIPAGPLRETLGSALQRIVAVILIGAADAQNIAAQVSVPVFRAQLKPELTADFPHNEKFFAFAGIGRPEKFYRTCRAVGLNLIGTMDFPDHHVFTDAELSELQAHAAAQNAKLLTTEKDWVRLPQKSRARIATLPVKLVFENNAALLSRLVPRI